ncbi:hypothetical protein IID62_07485 [candidate division KSB1 bacterium]|nr:hypothetical protein [candidate division KSB1 bacterium]
MSNKVLITGLGAITPCGNTVSEYWEAIKGGESGLAPITRFDTTGFTVTIAGEVKNFDPLDFMDRKSAKRMDRFTQFAVAASNLALP